MEKSDKRWGKWFFYVSLIIIAVVLYKTLDSFGFVIDWVLNLLHVLAPFIIGILLAYVFYIPVKNVEKLIKKCKLKWINKKARSISVISVYLIAVILICLVFRFIVPTMTNSIVEIINNLPGYYDMAIEKVNDIPDNSFVNADDIKNVIRSLQNIDFKSMLSLDNVMQYVKNVVGFARSIFDIFVTIMVSIYVLIDRKKIVNFLNRCVKAMFEEKKYEIIKHYFKKSNEVFFKFLSSQILDGIIVGILTSIIMLVLRVKYAVLLGFLIGLFNLIPYFGAIVAVGFAILITAFTGGITQAIWVAICVIIMQQIDANIINPKIVGNSLEISSLLVIFATTFFGAYFGFIGMFLAVPIMVIIKLFIENKIDEKLKVKEIKDEYKPIEFDGNLNDEIK